MSADHLAALTGAITFAVNVGIYAMGQRHGYRRGLDVGRKEREAIARCLGWSPVRAAATLSGTTATVDATRPAALPAEDWRLLLATYWIEGCQLRPLRHRLRFAWRLVRRSVRV